MAVQLRHKPAAQAVRHLVRRKVVNPDPGKGPERDFERAGPINAALKRVLAEPAFELTEDLALELFAAGKKESLREQRKVLVPVQFPDEFVIADRCEIQIT